MKKIFKNIIIITLLLFLTGCNYTELNDLSIIKSIGINYTNNEYTLYASLIDEIDKENKPTIKLIKTNNKDINKCFQELITLSNKDIHYSHIDLLILSTNLTNNELKEIFNYFLTNKEFRNDFTTISSNNINKLLENAKYDEIEQLISNNKHKKIIKVDIVTIIKNYYETKSFNLSLLDYENNKVIYKYNIKYKNNIIERINYEK